MKVKFLKPNFPPIRSYIFDLMKMYKNGQFSNNGPFVQKFEIELRKKMLSRTKPVCVNNATTGLIVALMALDLPKGNILVPSFTFPATVQSIMLAGFNPIFCDIDLETLMMEVPKDVPDVVAAMPVCVFGNEFYGLNKFYDYPDIKIVVDAAGALGVPVSKYDAIVYSFHATKALPVGEGGCVVFKNSEYETNAREIIDFGFNLNRDCVRTGLNGKMSELSAIIGLAGLKRIEESLKIRHAIASQYKVMLTELKLKELISFPKLTSYTSYQLFPIICRDSNIKRKLEIALNQAEIETKFYYHPCHLYPEFRNTYDHLPKTMDIAERIFCLPIYEKLTKKELNYVGKVINSIDF